MVTCPWQPVRMCVRVYKPVRSEFYKPVRMCVSLSAPHKPVRMCVRGALGAGLGGVPVRVRCSSPRRSTAAATLLQLESCSGHRGAAR